MWADYPDAFCTWEDESNLGRDVGKLREYEERKHATGSGHLDNPVCARNRLAVMDDNDDAAVADESKKQKRGRRKQSFDDDDEDGDDLDDDEEDEKPRRARAKPTPNSGSSKKPRGRPKNVVETVPVATASPPSNTPEVPAQGLVFDNF